MLETTIYIKCREEDKGDIEAMTDSLSNEFHTFMVEKTERDTYHCDIVIIEDEYLTAEQDMDCGGVVVYDESRKIMCKNTLVSRLKQTFEEALPMIRKQLFPSRD